MSPSRCLRNEIRESIPTQNTLGGLTYDDIRWFVDPIFLKELIQFQIADRVQVGQGEIGIIHGIVGKRRMSGIKDFVPFCTEMFLKCIMEFRL
jgi:hypothetical protein